MALTQAQRALVERARSAGGGALGTPLTDDACCYLVATIARDRGLLDRFPDLPGDLPGIFDERDPCRLVLRGLDFLTLLDRLLADVPDADTYFACLARLHKARLKYARILAAQPIPTMDQVGPRALLQYGQMPHRALAGLLLWRKWLFDIDNRAGQETGYLFEPIIANAIGGVPCGSRDSPVRRRRDQSKGRQVDCIRENHAYEFKIRLTIAASGQGRWREELDFPADCRHCGYNPVLIVLDATPNPRLEELARAFERAGGFVYIGDAAWRHLEEAAGDTMAVFLERYVRAPIANVLANTPPALPPIAFRMDEAAFVVEAEGQSVEYHRESPV